MGEPALDYHGCYCGYYIGIETKKPGETATKRQRRTMRKIRDAGGSVFLIAGIDSADFSQLIGWLMKPSPGFHSLHATVAMATKDNDDEQCND